MIVRCWKKRWESAVDGRHSGVDHPRACDAAMDFEVAIHWLEVLATDYYRWSNVSECQPPLNLHNP